MLLIAGALPVAVCMSKQVRGVARVHVDGKTSLLTFVKRLQDVARYQVSQFFSRYVCSCVVVVLWFLQSYQRAINFAAVRAQHGAVLRE